MQRLLAIPSLLLATFLFGGSNVVQKSVLSSLDVWSSMGFRGLIAALALLPFAFREFCKLQLPIRAVLRASAPVILWFTIGMVCQLIATKHTTATNLGFLINMGVVFVPFLLWAQTGTPPKGFIVATSLFCFSGASLLSGSAPTSFGLGDAICIVSALCYSGWIVSLGSMMQKVKAPVSVTLLQWIGPALVGFSLGPQDQHSLSAALTLAPQLVFLGAVAGGVGFLLAARAQSVISPCASAVCYSMEAVFGAGIAYLFLGEQLTTSGLVGAGITLASIILVQYEPRPAPRRVRIEPRFV